MELANITNTAVIIPAHNSGKSIKLLLPRVLKYFDSRSIFVIDDGSKDNTIKEAKKFKVNVAVHSKNRGKGAALQTGFTRAIKKNFEYAITIDSDLQHEPESIPFFLDFQNRYFAGLVIGKRSYNFGLMPIMRIFSNRITSSIIAFVTGENIKDSQSGFRLYRLEPIKNYTFKTKHFQFETEILFHYVRKNEIIVNLPINTIYSDERSYISHFRDIKNFIFILINELLKGF
jgi:glycosyltransferase involved in cell wall biosynthesis